MSKSIGKRERTKLMTEQHECCALCGYHFTVNKQVNYDKNKHTLICNPCSLFIWAWRSARERSITLPMICEYEAKNSELQV